MARFKKVNYEQMELIPLAFSDQILSGTFEYTLNCLVDNRVDLKPFIQKYQNDKTGAPAYNPGILLKIILYCYSRGIYSSRGIEYAARTNVIVKALSANSVPHFTVIAEFISSLRSEIIPVFRNILMVCSELDMIGGEMFAIDGCKISSNASKEWSGTFSDLKKKKEKFEKLSRTLVELHQEEDKKEEKTAEQKERNAKQIEKILNKAKKIEEFLEKEDPKSGKRSREIQSNITDNESAKMKTSHGVIQGYNGISLTDSKEQVIVYAEAFGTGHEGEALKPVIEHSQRLMDGPLSEATILADTNYFSEENLKYLSDKGFNGIIPDNQFRSRDSRFNTADRHKPERKGQFEREEFKFQSEKDRYICPAGKILRHHGNYKIKNISYARYEASVTDCRVCPLRKKCLKNENVRLRTLNRPLHVENRNYSNEMKAYIDTPEGRKLYSQRMGIVEPVFGNIRYCKGLDRFTLRGKKKVNIQWLLFCLVHNIGKIANHADRLGLQGV